MISYLNKPLQKSILVGKTITSIGPFKHVHVPIVNFEPVYPNKERKKDRKKERKKGRC